MNFPSRIQALLGAFLLFSTKASADEPLLIKELASREISIHVGGIQVPDIQQIASRELSIYVENGPLDGYPQVVSREISLVNVGPEPPPLVTGLRVTPSAEGTSVVLEWPTYNAWAIGDVAHFDVFLSDRPFTSVASLTPLARVSAESTGATLTNLPRFRDHFVAVLAVDALGNAQAILNSTGVYILSPQGISREISIYIGDEPNPPYRQVVSREHSIVVTTPEPPTPVGKIERSMSGSGESVSLAWNSYNPWLERDVGRFDVYLSNRPFTSVEGLAPHRSVPGEALSVTLDGLPTGRDHYLAVVPVDAAGHFNPAVTYTGAYLLSPELNSREMSLFVGDEPSPAYRQVVSREVSLVVPDAAVPAPVSALGTGFSAGESASFDRAIDLDWRPYNELLQRDVVRYRIYVGTRYFEDVSGMTSYTVVADGGQQATLGQLFRGGIYYVAVVAEDALGGFDPVVRAFSAQASNRSGAPSIVDDPGDLIVIEGAAATLQANAVGAGTLSYQWWHDARELSGETRGTLIIDPARPGHEGDYRVEVRSLLGRTLSEPAHLDVVSSPKVELPLADRTWVAGDSAAIQAGVNGEGLSFTWMRDGKVLAGLVDSVLTLSPVKPADAGLYTVIATNPAGRVTNGPARVRVHSPVAIRSQLPPLTTLNLGQGFSFTADVDGSGPFQFQWRLNGQDIPGATAATYTVPAVTLEHAGTYTVVIVDEFGAVTSDPARVVINTPVRPAGDNFIQRVSLAGIASPVSGTTLDATVEKDEPLHAAKPGLHSVWYSWTTPVAGRVTVRTVGSAFDTLLAVYTGTAVNALSEEGSNDDAPGGGFFTSEVSFSAQANTAYAIAIAGLGGESGSFVLSWSFTPSAPPVPRIVTHPGNTTQVAGGPVTLRVIAENATSVEWQLNGQLLAGVSGDTLLLPALDVSQVGSYVAVLRGGGQTIYSHPAIVEIGPQAGVHSYDKPEEFNASLGSGGGAAAAARTRYQREDVGISAPALIVTPGLPVGQWVNNAVNTTQQGEQNHCDQLVRRTGWLPVQAKVDGYLVIATTNTTVPTALALYEAANQLQSIACAQGNSVVLSSARAGRLYWLAFGSKIDTGGPIQIVCTAGVPPPFKKFEPELADVPPDSTVKLVAPRFESMIPPPKYKWFRDGKPLEGAASGELILNGTDLSGRYSVELDNGVGRELYDVAQIDLDRPLTTRSGNGGGGPGFDGTTFGFHLDGNPGQQVSVTRGTALDGWSQVEAFWLPAGGLNYRDPSAGSEPIGFYAAREVPLTVVPDGTYTDGRRGWKVIGGRLGRSYVLEASADGNLWTPVRTNRVAEGAYHHIAPAGGKAFLRVKP